MAIQDINGFFVGLLVGRAKTIAESAPQSRLHDQDGKSLKTGSGFRSRLRDGLPNASTKQSIPACPLLSYKLCRAFSALQGKNGYQKAAPSGAA